MIKRVSDSWSNLNFITNYKIKAKKKYTAFDHRAVSQLKVEDKGQLQEQEQSCALTCMATGISQLAEGQPQFQHVKFFSKVQLQAGFTCGT